MSLSPEPDFARLVRELLIDQPLARHLGLEPGDLDGAVQLARSDLLAGRSDRALDRFAQLVLIDPGAGDHHLGLAEAALAEGDPDLALQAAAAVIMDRPRAAEGWLISARACLAMGEDEAAAEDLADAERCAAAAGDSAALAMARRLSAALAQRSAAR